MENTINIFSNPYRIGLPANSYPSDQKIGRPSYLSPKKFSPREFSRAPIEMISNMLKMGYAYLTRNEEALIDTAGKVARTADSALSAIVGGGQAAAVAGVIIKKHFQVYTPLLKIPSLIKLISLQLGGIFGFLATVETLHEGSNLFRCFKLLRQLSSNDINTEQGVINNLNLIKTRFFSLSKEESSKISSYVERSLANSSQHEKANKFDEIANKILAVKYANLATRISPAFAKGVLDQLNSILKRIESGTESERKDALKEGMELSQMIQVQCKKKLLIHAIALIAIAISVTSLIGFCTGIGSIFFFAPLTVGATLLTLTHYFLENGLLTQKGWNFSFQACLPNWLKTLLYPSASKASGITLSESQAVR